MSVKIFTENLNKDLYTTRGGILFCFAKSKQIMYSLEGFVMKKRAIKNASKYFSFTT